MGIVRKTKSVKKVIDTFENANQALSVVELVKKYDGEMNKTTVYRILERLEEEGVLHSFTGKDGLKWFAKQEDASKVQSTHPHFQCQECGKSECLSVDVEIPSVPNYSIQKANLILVGACSDCQS